MKCSSHLLINELCLLRLAGQQVKLKYNEYKTSLLFLSISYIYSHRPGFIQHFNLTSTDTIYKYIRLYLFIYLFIALNKLF